MTATASLAEVSRLARVFHALSDETRLCIVGLLQPGERCVCELTDTLGTGQSRLSFHLKTLKEAGLVQDRKEGKWSYYSLVPGALEGLESAVQELTPATAVKANRARCC